jgi:hypothetical protein
MIKSRAMIASLLIAATFFTAHVTRAGEAASKDPQAARRRHDYRHDERRHW